MGPATEGRFPSLQIPDGFKATLFACDPLIEYPSVIALGPRAGSLFVAHDYVTGLGVEIIRRDELRLVEDSDGDIIGTANWTADYARGLISFTADQAGTTYFVTGRTYDLNAAAAD